MEMEVTPDYVHVDCYYASGDCSEAVFAEGTCDYVGVLELGIGADEAIEPSTHGSPAIDL